MNESKSELGRYMRELRKKREETLHKVAIGADIDSPQLSKIERGERLPTVAQVKKLAAWFNVPEDELMTKLAAEKILKHYGANEITFNAVRMVEEQLSTYNKKA